MKMATTFTQNRRMERLAHIWLTIIALICVGTAVLAPVLASNWANLPFMGTLLYPKQIVSNYHHSNWQPSDSLLQPNDRLLTVDGQSLPSNQALISILRNKSVGEMVQVGFLSQSPTATSPQVESIRLITFPVQHLLTFFWFPYIVGLIYLAVAIIIYQLRGLDDIGSTYIAFCLLTAIFLFGLFDYHTYHILTPVWGLSLPLIGATILHLAFIYPNKIGHFRNRYPLYIGFYLIATLIGGFFLYEVYLSTSTSRLTTTWLSIFFLVGLTFLIFYGRLVYTRLTTISADVSQQTSIVLLGSLLAFTPVVILLVSLLLNDTTQLTQWIVIATFLPLVLFPFSFGYAIFRYQINDLDSMFSRTTAYVLLTLAVTVGYIIIASVLATWLGDDEIFRDPILLLALVTTLVIALGYLRERLQTFINRRFLRIAVDYRYFLQSYGQELIATPLEVGHILELFTRKAEEALTATPLVVFLRNSLEDAFTVQYQVGLNATSVRVTFGLSDDLAQWLSDTNDVLQLNPNGQLISAGHIHAEEIARLNMLNIILCVPLLGSTRLLGWLSIGLKKSGQPYNSDDLMFLATMASQTTIALENAQLLKNANQRAAELEALQKISLKVQAQPEPDALLTSVVEEATQLLQVQGGLVWFLDTDRITLRVVVSYNLDQNYTGRTIRMGTDIAGRVLLLGEPVSVDNYQIFAGRSQIFDDALFGAALGVPLTWGGKDQGVLQLVHQPNGLRFGKDDTWLMQLFASQSAIALEKSQLLQNAHKRANQLAMLSEVSQTISSTLDLKTVLSQVMESAVAILNVEAGSLFLTDEQSKELTFEFVHGPKKSELIGSKIPVGVGIVGTVAKTSEPLIINDVSNDPRWHTSFDEETDFRTRDVLCVPMIAADRVVGVIEVINKKDREPFTPEDSTLLLSFAVQAAIVIENAQIFTRTDEALAERVQELQTLQVFDEELQGSLELDRVLDISLTTAMDALGVAVGIMGIFKGGEEEGLHLPIQYGTNERIHRYKDEPWPLRRGVIGRVARTGRVALVNDVSQDPDYIPKSRITQAILVVPVIRDEKVIGVIDLESMVTNYFTEGDVKFVQLLASHSAFAIQNAQLFEQAQSANKAKSEFMNTASHDLKVPMTSIKGYSKMLKIGAGGPLSETQQEFVDIIYNNIERMSRLVNDLLDVSRIEAGRIRLEVSDVQMAEVIHDVLNSVGAQIEERQLNLHLQIEPDLPSIRADYHRLVQIVTNFVSNAYKYTPDGGDVTVKAYAVKSGISVSVQDTGYGISDEDQAKLFTTFFRASDPNIRAQPGTGLGLSITKRMIESHGGNLTLRSKLGEGSTFTFTLPLVSKIPPGVEVVEK